MYELDEEYSEFLCSNVFCRVYNIIKHIFECAFIEVIYMMEDICEISIDETEHIASLRKTVDEKPTIEAANLFKVLSDPTRLKIAYAIMLEQLCVCDVAHIANVSNATASHHLRLLRDLGYVSYRKKGKMAYYKMKDENVKRLLQLMLNESMVTTNE